MPRRPPGEMDAPLALVSRVSSLGPTANGNGGKTRGSVAVSSSFRPYIWQVEVAIFVGLLSMSNMVTESLSLHDTLSNLVLILLIRESPSSHDENTNLSALAAPCCCCGMFAVLEWRCHRHDSAW